MGRNHGCLLLVQNTVGLVQDIPTKLREIRDTRKSCWFMQFETRNSSYLRMVSRKPYSWSIVYSRNRWCVIASQRILCSSDAGNPSHVPSSLVYFLLPLGGGIFQNSRSGSPQRKARPRSVEWNPSACKELIGWGTPLILLVNTECGHDITLDPLTW